MRPTGRAAVSRARPEAHAVCDRCGFRYLHRDLHWQYQWSGVRLQNIRLLVCDECYDTPQEQLRRIVIPPDPLPIMNPRPENYTSDDNPVSTLGFDPIVGFGDNFGSTSNYNAAFDGSINKAFRWCAIRAPSVSGLNNYVGKNWNATAGNVATPSGLVGAKILTYNITQFAAYAPSDAPFIAGGAAVAYKLQGSNTGGTYTDLFTGTTAGTNGESISHSVTTSGYYQYHRIVFTGDGVNAFGIAQLQMTGTPLAT